MKFDKGQHLCVYKRLPDGRQVFLWGAVMGVFTNQNVIQIGIMDGERLQVQFDATTGRCYGYKEQYSIEIF